MFFGGQLEVEPSPALVTFYQGQHIHQQTRVGRVSRWIPLDWKTETHQDISKQKCKKSHPPIGKIWEKFKYSSIPFIAMAFLQLNLTCFNAIRLPMSQNYVTSSSSTKQSDQMLLHIQILTLSTNLFRGFLLQNRWFVGPRCGWEMLKSPERRSDLNTPITGYSDSCEPRRYGNDMNLLRIKSCDIIVNLFKWNI